MEIRSLRSEFFQPIAVWALLYGHPSRIPAKRMEKKGGCEQYKNAECSFEQTMKAAPYKTTAARPLTAHLINYQRKQKKTY